MFVISAPRILRLLLGAALLLCLIPARAVTVGGLYEAEVAVAAQDETERQRGFRMALSEVLTKLTGDSAAPQRAELSGVMGNAAGYVSQFRYENAELPEGVEASAEMLEAAGHRLFVRFTPAVLERDLRDRGIALWGSERPETLLWLAVEHGRQRFLLGGDVDTVINDQLLVAAQRRALPVLLPLMDLEDERALQYSDVRGSFTERVLAASNRYAADAVLTGHLGQLGDGSWSAEWSLVEGGRPVRWSASDRSLEVVLDAGMEGLARELASRFSVRGGSGDIVSLRVNRVSSLAEYARLQQAMVRMPVVREVQVERVSAGVVVFRLQLNGSAVDFERAVRLKRLLNPAPADLGARGGADLEYDLLPN